MSVSRDYLVVDFSHPLLFWLFIGLIAGWVAGKVSRGRGFGCLTDILLGLVGAFLGGWIFMKLGIWGGGFFYSLAAATVGAIILVAIVRLFARD
ncbi:MAG TPA: GlsB/YeaQ/YmgE family stress response membrane protein [Candidatus Dormibacteraeota bacterium]|nr:GlsB/YeaQ/YmgE family stress response membrane protein [Candidatus Dormibacteraeota bacterium]